MRRTTYGGASCVACPRCEMPISLSNRQEEADCKSCGLENIEISYETTCSADIEIPDEQLERCKTCHFERWLHGKDPDRYVAVCHKFKKKASR